jgi:hypothetical protein
MSPSLKRNMSCDSKQVRAELACSRTDLHSCTFHGITRLGKRGSNLCEREKGLYAPVPSWNRWTIDRAALQRGENHAEVGVRFDVGFGCDRQPLDSGRMAKTVARVSWRCVGHPRRKGWIGRLLHCAPASEHSYLRMGFSTGAQEGKEMTLCSHGHATPRHAAAHRTVRNSAIQ